LDRFDLALPGLAADPDRHGGIVAWRQSPSMLTGSPADAAGDVAIKI
jgi:hypothetical protein